jgi:hypothetical protein
MIGFVLRNACRTKFFETRARNVALNAAQSRHKLGNKIPRVSLADSFSGARSFENSERNPFERISSRENVKGGVSQQRKE